MTDKEYLNQMIAYVKKLELSAEAEPFDRQIFHDTVEIMQGVHNAWLRSRRCRFWQILVFCCVLICLLAWVVYSILF